MLVLYLKNLDNKINDKNIYKNFILVGSNVKIKFFIKWFLYFSDFLSCFLSF